jgi:hypothetical protein
LARRTVPLPRANTYFILKNGAKAENIYWALGTSAILGVNSVLEVSILVGTAITFETQSKLHGCALAQSAVTFESEGSAQLHHSEDYEDSVCRTWSDHKKPNMVAMERAVEVDSQ